VHSAAQPDGPELACSFPSGLPRVSFVFLSKAHETVELAHLMRVVDGIKASFFLGLRGKGSGFGGKALGLSVCGLRAQGPTHSTAMVQRRRGGRVGGGKDGQSQSSLGAGVPFLKECDGGNHLQVAEAEAAKARRPWPGQVFQNTVSVDHL